MWDHPQDEMIPYNHISAHHLLAFMVQSDDNTMDATLSRLIGAPTFVIPTILCRMPFLAHTHKLHNRFTAFGFCPGQPGWAGTRRNIHPLAPIMVINHPLSASSIYYDPWHPLCSIYVPDTVFFCNVSLSFLWSTSWPGSLRFILHTFLHPVIVFFLQHMPIPSQPVLL